MISELKRLIHSHAKGYNDLFDVLVELTAEEWAILVEAGSAIRCETCLEVECTCPDED